MRGHIHKRQWKGRGGQTRTLWYVVVDVGTGPDGKRKQKWHGGFKTRREAEAASADIIRDLENQSYIAPNQQTLAQYALEEWIPTMATQVKHSTWDSYRRNLENHVLPTLGGVPLQKLTPGHLNRLYAGLLEDGSRKGGGGLSAKTVKNVHGAISKLLADAADQGLVGRNVGATAKPPKPKKNGAAEIRFWTPDELSTFLRHVHDDHFYALWHLASMTGMRRGELLGLRWQDLDLETRRCSIRQTVISVGYAIEITTPKSHRARVIDLDAGTVEVLRAHRRRQSDSLTDGGAGAALVFLKSDGTMPHPDVVRTMFDRRVKASGLRRIRFHDLRHTHATIGLRAGVEVKVMSERLGHSAPAFTLQQYAHVIPGMQAEAAEAIADLIDVPPDSPQDDLPDDPQEDTQD